MAEDELSGTQLNTTVVMIDTTPFSQAYATGVGKTSEVSTMTCVNKVNQVRHPMSSFGPALHAPQVSLAVPCSL